MALGRPFGIAQGVESCLKGFYMLVSQAPTAPHMQAVGAWCGYKLRKPIVDFGDTKKGSPPLCSTCGLLRRPDCLAKSAIC